MTSYKYVAREGVRILKMCCACVYWCVVYKDCGMLWSGICNSCNMGTRDLPDLYAQSPRAKGMHIRQITRAHDKSNMYHFWLWVLDMMFLIWFHACSIKSSQKHHIWNSQSNLSSYTINVIFRLGCLGQLNDCAICPRAPMVQKPQPCKETFSNQIQI